MNKNLLALAVGAASAMSAASLLACPYERLVATPPPAPRTSVWNGDDYGTNGRLWQSRALVNGGAGPYYSGNPGAEAYGARGEEDQIVYVRVGQVAVSISAWDQYTLDGMQMFETARQQWLTENGYQGGVRTFRRDAAPAAETEVGADAGPAHAAKSAVPQPRATIQIPEGARRKPGHHVDSGRAGEAAVRLAALKTGDKPVRISWPMNAPVEAKARTEAHGGYLTGAPVETCVVTVMREP